MKWFLIVASVFVASAAHAECSTYKRTLDTFVWAELEAAWIAADEAGRAKIENAAVALGSYEAAVAGVEQSGASRCKHECTALNVISCIAQLPVGCFPHCCGCDDDKTDGCDHCSKCNAPCAQGGQCSSAETDALKALAMDTEHELGESCFDRCNKCHHASAECGHEPCGQINCWYNCSHGHHPVCCHGCNEGG